MCDARAIGPVHNGPVCTNDIHKRYLLPTCDSQIRAVPVPSSNVALQSPGSGRAELGRAALQEWKDRRCTLKNKSPVNIRWQRKGGFYSGFTCEYHFWWTFGSTEPGTRPMTQKIKLHPVEKWPARERDRTRTSHISLSLFRYSAEQGLSV
jgi:hypothetical protein